MADARHSTAPPRAEPHCRPPPCSHVEVCPQPPRTSRQVSRPRLHVPRAGAHVDADGFTLIESRRRWRHHRATHPRHRATRPCSVPQRRSSFASTVWPGTTWRLTAASRPAVCTADTMGTVLTTANVGVLPPTTSPRLVRRRAVTSGTNTGSNAPRPPGLGLVGGPPSSMRHLSLWGPSHARSNLGSVHGHPVLQSGSG
jgi:hypothetical protein